MHHFATNKCKSQCTYAETWSSGDKKKIAQCDRRWHGTAELTWYIVGGSDLIVNYKLHKVTISISDIPDVFVAVCCLLL